MKTASASSLTLAAVGDISFARGTAETCRQRGADFLLGATAADLAAADIRFGNFESVLVPPDFPLEKCSGRPLYSHDDVLAALAPLRFDVLHAASNHVLDCGWRGLLHTCERLNAIGALTLGAGTDQNAARALRVIRKNNTSIGFLGYLQAGDWTLEGGGGRVAYLSPDDIIADIRRHRASVDVLAISLHADIEFQPAPSWPRLQLCRQIAEAGADLILCHHPHVPQGVERWNNCLIHYSLGNFLFDIRGYQLGSSSQVSRSHIFLVEINHGKITGWRRKFYRIQPDEGGRPLPLPEDACPAEERYYCELDQNLRDPQRLRELWHANSEARLAAWLQQLQRQPDITPAQFLRQYGRQLFSPMCREYLDGIRDLAEQQYRQHGQGDFEFKRPFAPYES